MISTARLNIIPLTYDQLVKYVKCDNSLEKELNLNPNSRTISDELKEALENTILPNVADKAQNYLFSTLWTAISVVDNSMVGDEYQGKGYMTEMVGGIIEWAKTQSLVKSIIASTEKSNLASYKVLEKNNFIQMGETSLLYNWKLEL